MWEYIFIDDGSSDRTLEVIKGLAEKDKKVKYISFLRNFGKEAAMYAGIEHSLGGYVAIMDADMQDPPSLLPEMYKILVGNNGYDCVATRRVTRKGEPPIRSFFARTFYKIINRISKTEIVDGARDFRIMTRQVVNAVLSIREFNRFSKGIFGWVGFHSKWVEYENIERVAGTTKWSFWKLLLYSFDGIMAFSTVPLAIASVTGLTFFHRYCHGNYIWSESVDMGRYCSGLSNFNLCNFVCRRNTAFLYWATWPVFGENIS